MKTGYLRVSTDDQSTNRQIDALESVCDKLYFEQVSACAKSRPVYEQITSSPNPEDTLVVWSVDRAYRSTVDAILEVEKIHKRGANFQILNLNIDTATPDGMLVYTMLAALAQWERATLSERTKQGLAAARRRGRRLGRPRKLSERKTANALRLLEKSGATLESVAMQLGVSQRTLRRRIGELCGGRHKHL